MKQNRRKHDGERSKPNFFDNNVKNGESIKLCLKYWGEGQRVLFPSLPRPGDEVPEVLSKVLKFLYALSSVI